MTAIFNTLQFAKKAKEVGFTEAQAEFQAEEIARIIDENLPTKADFKALEKATKTDLKNLEKATKADFMALEKATKADLKNLEKATKADFMALEKATKADLKNLEQATKANFIAFEKATKADLKELKKDMTIATGGMLAVAVFILPVMFKLISLI